MEFYKERDFSALVSDSFGFFKQYGRNYFSNYLALNGAVLLLLVVVSVIGYGEIIKQLVGGNIYGESYLFEQYFAQNSLLLIVASLLIAILLILLGVLNYSFPVFYIKRLAEGNQAKIKMSDIADDLRNNSGILLKFFFGCLFIVLPLGFIAFVLSGFLMLVFIGFLLLLILIPTLTNLVNFTLFDMINRQEGFLTSLKNAFEIQFSRKYWKYLGTTLILYVLIQILSSAIGVIPFFYFYFQVLYSQANDVDTTFLGLLGLVYVLGILLSLILSNLIYVGTGLMYYDSRTDLHRQMAYVEIDNIGKEE